jgi:hypothetical protein
MPFESDASLPLRQHLLSRRRGTQPGLVRTAPVRLSALLLIAAAASAAEAACGGGSPASPTFTPMAPVSGGSGDAAAEDAGSDLADDAASPAADFARCGTSPATGTFPADVEAILSSRCQTCHADPPVNGAPFPLLTYSDVHMLFAGTLPIYQEMYMLIQPDGIPHMPFGNAPQLTSEQLQTLSSWLLSCAPSGS